MNQKTIYIILIVAVIATVVGALQLRSRDAVGAGSHSVAATSGAQQAPSDSSSELSRQQQQQQEIVVAPGRIEPISEEIEIGAEINGKIKQVMVEEGDDVQRGQVLAVLENSDYEAQLASAQAERLAAEAQLGSAEARVEQAQAELRRVANGARIEERREARATVEQADAVLRNARSELERRRILVRDGDIAREELERAERDLLVAEARSKELRERFAFVNAAAREEDVARSTAAVRLAEAQIREARAQIRNVDARIREAQAHFEKSLIRAAISGRVLRKRLKAGESVSPESVNSSIFTLADTSVLRVRVDVDETDVGRIRVGQPAYVRADAYGEQRFSGRVVRIGQVLGKKNIRTEEPTERVDTKVLETLVELDQNQKLPLGLRVDTFIIVGNSPAKTNEQAEAKFERVR